LRRRLLHLRLLLLLRLLWLLRLLRLLRVGLRAFGMRCIAVAGRFSAVAAA
jgi:hypothetical protein